MNIEDILFLDIETIPQYSEYEGLSERQKLLWTKKARLIIKSDEETPDSIYPRAGIYAEFGKVISIAIGYLRKKDGQLKLRIKDLSGHSEKSILDKVDSI